MKYVKKLSGLCFLAAAILFSPTSFSAKDSLPDGYSHYLTYIANGSFPANDPHPVIPNCQGAVCATDYFQTHIMNRDQATIDQLTNQAASFYLNRFGVDVTDPANIGRVQFFNFMLDPRLEYRAYHVSGKKPPTEGWVVRDGGWILLITDPNGFTLGGEFSGATVPAGTMFFYGEYNIHASSSNSSNEDIIISYRSGSPIVANPFGLIPFACEISTATIAENFPNGTEGLAQGFSGPLAPNQQGILVGNTRNTLTFSDNGGL